MDKKPNTRSQQDLWRYAGLATQFLVAIGIGVFIGLQADKYLNFGMPVLVWVLPLLIITGVIIKMIKDTSKK